jgi:choice-of-anchor B domain-containing protein
MKTTLGIFFIASLGVISNLHAQILNENAALLGKLAPPRGGRDSFKYADVWGYNAPDGREYGIIGCYDGTSIIEVTDPGNPVERAFIPGPQSFYIWREIRTHSHYAYVTQDGVSNNPNHGMQIIDLSQLPAAAALVNTYNSNLPNGTAHNLYIDNGYAYLSGTQTGNSVVILSLENPISPVEVSRWGARYWHDVIVKNDTIYGSAGSSALVDIVDGRNKTNLQLISQAIYPSGYTHNAWMTGDNHYLVQTDEVHDFSLNFWDMTNHLTPELVATYHGGAGSIAHNAQVRGNIAFVSYYFDGLKVIDISQRRAPVEVANYDTYPDDAYQRGPGFEGAWGVYPFLASGNILISDITTGLHIVKFNGAQAGYVSGIIKNKNTSSPLSDVNIELLNRNLDEGRSIVNVGLDGQYIFGAKPGTRSFRFTKTGYADVVLSGVSIQTGVVLQQDILMDPGTTGMDDSPRLPTSLELLQNYPNPFNPSTTIRWRQPASGVAQISVFNHLGQRVAVFENIESSAGGRQFTIDLKNFASGIYFYRINVNGAISEMKKMILLR